jgi:phosphate uptake regulator
MACDQNRADEVEDMFHDAMEAFINGDDDWIEKDDAWEKAYEELDDDCKDDMADDE